MFAVSCKSTMEILLFCSRLYRAASKPHLTFLRRSTANCPQVPWGWCYRKDIRLEKGTQLRPVSFQLTVPEWIHAVDVSGLIPLESQVMETTLCSRELAHILSLNKLAMCRRMLWACLLTKWNSRKRAAVGMGWGWVSVLEICELFCEDSLNARPALSILNLFNQTQLKFVWRRCSLMYNSKPIQSLSQKWWGFHQRLTSSLVKC